MTTVQVLHVNQVTRVAPLCGRTPSMQLVKQASQEAFTTENVEWHVRCGTVSVE